ncbi:hypothetical protein GC090_08240 [Pantoea sp. JZ29]|uniref:hypothetical protein n=1 Tax=Pantoea sp. JZ29 TaxID=2654192 RepID=UPI002B4A4331|nr:hypothetical protein [Pantoea sp. JZ29]WRH20656.1 hypothetical protein GC090_08240 [Pantoea sp. JZ29]
MAGTEKIKDGLKYVSENNSNETVTVNFYSWVNLIKGIMIFYGMKTEDEAQSIIDDNPLFNNPPHDYFEACLLGHDDEYYWAMVMSHGDRYFEKGFSRVAPDDYYEWESNYLKEHGLASETLIFSE